MGIFDFLKAPDINRGVEDCNAHPGAVLLDVRTAQEYREGHIPGSRNIPLPRLEEEIAFEVPEEDTAVYVYCLSGARSRQATALLRHMGYTNIHNIGGISAYRGNIER